MDDKMEDAIAQLHIEEIETGFALVVPRELNPLFSKTFKSAHFNSELVRWEVGKRSKPKLDAWMREVRELVKELEDEKEHSIRKALTKQELKSIRDYCAGVRKHIRNLESDYHDLLANEEQLLAQAQAEKDSLERELRELQEKMDNALPQVKKLRKERDALKESVRLHQETLLNTSCDLTEIQQAHYEMKTLYKKVLSSDKDRYHEAQAVIAKQLEYLKQTGYTSPGLERLCVMNFRRPDRDNPWDVTHYLPLVAIEK